MVDEFSELSTKQAIESIKEHFVKGVTVEESWGKDITAKRVEIFGGTCWQIGDNFLCSDEFMEALKSHPYEVNQNYLDVIFTAKLKELEQELIPPKKIGKPKHTPPFWANNWRKK